jgi:hypothetical protein
MAKLRYNRNSGKIVRPKKQLRQHIAMADAKIKINGCQVFLGHPNPQKATQAAGQFAKFLAETMMRASVPNMSDMYNAHFETLHRLEQGESIEEIFVIKN